MKVVLFLLTWLLIGHNIVHSQLKPINWQKLCVEGDVSSIMHMKFHQKTLIVKIANRSVICGLDSKTNEVLWTYNFSHKNAPGYGLYSYGENLIYSSNANTMDEKDKVTIASYIFQFNPTTQKKVDSIKLSYDAIYLSDSPGKSGNLALIRMTNDNKYS
jgi:hypothetical protein